MAIIIPAIKEVIVFLSMQEQQGKSTFTLQDLLSLQPNKSQRKDTEEKVMYLQIFKLVSLPQI
jgi:hypothetical protein